MQRVVNNPNDILKGCFEKYKTEIEALGKSRFRRKTTVRLSQLLTATVLIYENDGYLRVRHTVMIFLQYMNSVSIEC
jgi:hypothetical protein